MRRPALAFTLAGVLRECLPNLFEGGSYLGRRELREAFIYRSNRVRWHRLNRRCRRSGWCGHFELREERAKRQPQARREQFEAFECRVGVSWLAAFQFR